MSLRIPSWNQVYAGNGTPALPSISFATQPTCGFSINGQLIVLSENGTARTAWNGSQLQQISAGLFGWSSTSDPTAAADATMGRAASGSVNFGGVGNGQLIGVQVLAENVIIAAAATSTSTIQLPANAILLGVTSRVTTVGVTSWPATYSVAIGATTVSSGISTVLNTTDPGTLLCPIQKAAATAITITPIATPGDAIGRIRCTIHFLQLTPATS